MLGPSEAVIQRYSVKNVFLETLQNSQENICARISFLIKLQAQPAMFLKKSLWHKCFPVNTFSYRAPPAAASVPS